MRPRVKRLFLQQIICVWFYCRDFSTHKLREINCNHFYAVLEAKKIASCALNYLNIRIRRPAIQITADIGKGSTTP